MSSRVDEHRRLVPDLDDTGRPRGGGLFWAALAALVTAIFGFTWGLNQAGPRAAEDARAGALEILTALELRILERAEAAYGDGENGSPSRAVLLFERAEGVRRGRAALEEWQTIKSLAEVLP